jgi:molybdopterin-binding protein
MNRFQASITQIESEGSLHIVTFDFEGTQLRMMSLELGAEVRVGSVAILTIKSTYIALAKTSTESFADSVSYTNLIPATITQIQQGKLLSSIQLDAGGYRLESIITRGSAERMKLAANDKVTMLIKASELSIVEVVK